MARQHQRIEYQASSWPSPPAGAPRPDRSSQSSSAMSCTIGRSPTSRFRAANASMRATPSGALKSVQPTTPRTNSAFLRDIEQKHRLGLGRRGLHQDSPLDCSGGEMRRQVREPKVAIDRRQLWRQPAIVATGERPQMMMRIDPHQRSTDDGTGASVSSRCCAFRSVQNADGT